MSKSSSTASSSSDGTSTSSPSSSCDATSVGEAAALLDDSSEAKQDDLAGDKAEPATSSSKDRKGKGKSKASDQDDEKTSLESVEVLFDKPGHRKELRTSKNGRKYELETQGLWTVLRGLTPSTKQRTLRERLKKRLKELAGFWPFLRRFVFEVLSLGRWRFVIHLMGSTIKGLVPVSLLFA